MAIKTYVLLDSMNADAEVYQQIPGGQREKITKIPLHRPYLDIMVEDKEGVQRRLRYKAGSKFLFADEQMDKEKIDANVKFTDLERNETYFRHGSLTTSKTQLQAFLEANPEFEGSIYKSDSVHKKTYRLLDPTSEAKIKNADFKKRLAAANKIAGLDLQEAKDMIVRLNGSYVVTSDELDICQNRLMEFLDDHEDEGIEAIMKEDKDITKDEQTTILIGKLISAGILKFDISSDKIFKKDKAGKEIEVRNIFAETMEERERLFSNFLDTSDGKALRSDLEKDLADFEKEKKKSKP